MKSFNDLKHYLKSDLSNLPKLNISLVGDTATQLLVFAIRGEGAVRGYNLEMFEAEYNQVERQFLDPSSELYSIDSEYIILFQSTHKLLESHSLSQEKERLADKRLAFISSICDNPALRAKKIICFNYPEIDDTVFGNYSNKIQCSFTYQVRKLNNGLMSLAEKYPNLYICDLSAIQNKIGRDSMFSPNIYTSTEMILSINSLPYVASRILDIICALEGHFKKCLIVDLDNTLWGGIIGDDGLEGIHLGHGLGIGKAFTELQLWIKKLCQRGIILCVASKNNEETAKEPFLKHPEMIIRLDDIAVFQANWENKVDNIRTIQKILNISYDSMVFLDDNPFERNLVRDNIEGITVPELPEDPAEYLEFLYSLNLFETASYSLFDKDRTKQYQIEAERVSLSKTFKNEADFLKSLNMVSTVSSFTGYNIPRVAQLSQRSNQFNLRTIRYNENSIAEIANIQDVIDICFTLEDKFGDNGVIAVIILKPWNNDALFLDTWLMSCRVLKRGMEFFTLNTIVERAKSAGYKKIIGEYLPTSKNKMVENLLPDLGFKKVEGTKQNIFALDVDTYVPKNCYIKNKQSI